MPPVIEGSGSRANLKRVTTPKLPPPPRIAQNRSGCSSASARTSRPSAVMTSAARRRSIVRPYLRTRKPIPPPSVSPPIPTDPVSPKPTAKPCSANRVVTSPAVRPAPVHAVRASWSISSSLSSVRSSTIPPSLTPWPAAPCPPLRTASSIPVSRASPTTCATSAASAGRTTTAGRRSWSGEKSARAESYSGSSGPITCPLTVVRSSAAEMEECEVLLTVSLLARGFATTTIVGLRVRLRTPRDLIARTVFEQERTIPSPASAEVHPGYTGRPARAVSSTGRAGDS